MFSEDTKKLYEEIKWEHVYNDIYVHRSKKFVVTLERHFKYSNFIDLKVRAVHESNPLNIARFIMSENEDLSKPVDISKSVDFKFWPTYEEIVNRATEIIIALKYHV